MFHQRWFQKTWAGTDCEVSIRFAKVQFDHLRNSVDLAFVDGGND